MIEMTPEQEAHLQSIKNVIAAKLDAKYRKGQAEHGGNLWDRNPLEDLVPEIVDLITYTHSAVDWIAEIRRQIEYALGYMNEGMNAEAWDAMKQAHKLISRTNTKP